MVVRWVCWVWVKQVYVTDLEQVRTGIQRILNGETLSRKTRLSHRDLWTKIEKAIQAKGRENFRVEKVKAHQRKEEQTREAPIA